MEWIKDVHARGLAGPLRLALDVLEPLGPLGAQVLWVVQPVAGVVGARELIGRLATTLEDPAALATVRAALDDYPLG